MKRKDFYLLQLKPLMLSLSQPAKIIFGRGLILSPFLSLTNRQITPTPPKQPQPAQPAQPAEPIEAVVAAGWYSRFKYGNRK